MNNIGEKFLPIGTVVMLKGASKRLMITGFCSMAEEDQNVMYDYAGCMYPEGFLSSDQTALFNHDQIETVYHMGLVDEEEKTFKENLKGLLSTQQLASATPAAPVAPATPAVEEDVPPVGPGLPGYVAPQESEGFTFAADGTVIAAATPAPVAPVSEATPEQPAATEQPASSSTTPTAIKFDENGVVVAA